MFLTTDRIDEIHHSPDVIVVGSGPAGLTVARALEAGGASVALLESGGRRRARPALNATDVISQPFVGGLTRGRLFGGTGQRWAGQCLRLDGIDYEERPWVEGSGWALPAASLAPWLAHAEEMLQIDSSTTPGADIAKRSAYAAFDPMVTEWRTTVYSPDHRLGSRYRREIASSNRISCLTDTTATRVLVDGNRSAIGVELRDRAGRRHRLSCATVILCAGAIENARLLLASGKPKWGGLGDGQNWVGKGFQDHPYTFPAEVINGSDELDALYQSEWVGGYRSRPRTTLTADVQKAERILNVIIDLELIYDSSSATGALKRLHHAVSERQRLEHPVRDLAVLARNPGLPLGLAKTIIRRSGRDAWIAALGRPAQRLVRVQTEQPPLGPSAVTLSPLTDAYGERLPAVDWTVGKQEWQTTRTAVHYLAEQFERTGLGQIRAFRWLQDFEAWRTHTRDFSHHAGTTRMAQSPSDGVVDIDGRVHGVTGLYVTGGSVFPTSGYANPTLTIVALGARLADHVLHER